MLNIFSIHKQVVRAVLQSKLLTQKHIVDKNQFKNNLIVEVDNIVNNILINLADSYPQAPISGGTPRIKEVITEVNRMDDPKNDLIFNSKTSSLNV